MQESVIAYSKKHPFAKKSEQIISSNKFANEAELILNIKHQFLDTNNLNKTCKNYVTKTKVTHDCILEFYKELYQGFNFGIESRILLNAAFNKAILDQKKYLQKNFPQPKKLIELNVITQFQEIGIFSIQESIHQFNENEERSQKISAFIKLELHLKDSKTWIDAIEKIQKKYEDKLTKIENEYQNKKNLLSFSPEFEIIKNKFLDNKGELTNLADKLKLIEDQWNNEIKKNDKNSNILQENILTKFYGILFSGLIQLTLI